MRNQRSCLCQHCSEPRWGFLVEKAFPHTRHNNMNDRIKHNLSVISFILSILVSMISMLPLIWELPYFANSRHGFANSHWISDDLKTIALIFKSLPEFSNPISVSVADHMETPWVCKRVHIQSRVIYKPLSCFANPRQ